MCVCVCVSAMCMCLIRVCCMCVCVCVCVCARVCWTSLLCMYCVCVLATWSIRTELYIQEYTEPYTSATNANVHKTAQHILKKSHRREGRDARDGRGSKQTYSSEKRPTHPQKRPTNLPKSPLYLQQSLLFMPKSHQYPRKVLMDTQNTSSARRTRRSRRQSLMRSTRLLYDKQLPTGLPGFMMTSALGFWPLSLASLISCICICICVYMYVCMYTRMYVCVHVYMCINIDKHQRLGIKTIAWWIQN